MRANKRLLKIVRLLNFCYVSFDKLVTLQHFARSAQNETEILLNTSIEVDIHRHGLHAAISADLNE